MNLQLTEAIAATDKFKAHSFFNVIWFHVKGLKNNAKSNF